MILLVVSLLLVSLRPLCEGATSPEELSINGKTKAKFIIAVPRVLKDGESRIEPAEAESRQWSSLSMPWNTNQKSGKMYPNRPRPRNHNLRLASFQGTFPYESEVIGDGYHSRIRFNPFGASFGPPKSKQHKDFWVSRPHAVTEFRDPPIFAQRPLNLRYQDQSSQEDVSAPYNENINNRYSWNQRNEPGGFGSEEHFVGNDENQPKNWKRQFRQEGDIRPDAEANPIFPDEWTYADQPQDGPSRGIAPNVSVPTTEFQIEKPNINKSKDHDRRPVVKFPEPDLSKDYYENLYDEFIEAYYDIANEGKDVDFPTDARIEQPSSNKETVKHRNTDISSPSVISDKNVSTITPIKDAIIPQYSRVSLDSKLFDTFPTLEALEPTSVPRKIIILPTTKRPMQQVTLFNILSSASAVPKSNPVTTISPAPKTVYPISLSEVLQGVDLSLPQFLTALKEHNTSLIKFTEGLDAKSLNEREFKSVKGNLTAMMNLLFDEKDERNNTVLPAQMSTFQPSTKRFSTAFMNIPSTIPITSTMKTTSTIKPSPRIFGFTSSFVSEFREGREKDGSINSTNATSALIKPVVVNIDIATLMKEKGLSAVEILTQRQTNKTDSHEINNEEKSHNDKNYTASSNSSLMNTNLLTKLNTDGLNPYRPLGYEGGWSRENSDRSVIRSRMSSTERTIHIPKYIPPSPKTPLDEDYYSVDEAPSEREITSSSTIQSILDDYFGLSNFEGNLQNANVSTRSAILAAAILGGVTLCVFLAILIVVMYRSQVQSVRRLALPLSVPSDSSSSSTPPLYSSRLSPNYVHYKTSGFWDTLKKRFDPYTVSTTPTSVR